jgi:hypothetical protein
MPEYNILIGKVEGVRVVLEISTYGRIMLK